MPFYTASKSTFEVGGKEFPRITWYKEPGMRGMYFTLMLAVLTSATNGYDGSMMNGLQVRFHPSVSKHSMLALAKKLDIFADLSIQTLPQWQDCE